MISFYTAERECDLFSQKGVHVPSVHTYNCWLLLRRKKFCAVVWILKAYFTSFLKYDIFYVFFLSLYSRHCEPSFKEFYYRLKLNWFFSFWTVFISSQLKFFMFFCLGCQNLLSKFGEIKLMMTSFWFIPNLSNNFLF